MESNILSGSFLLFGIGWALPWEEGKSSYSIKRERCITISLPYGIILISPKYRWFHSTDDDTRTIQTSQDLGDIGLFVSKRTKRGHTGIKRSCKPAQKVHKIFKDEALCQRYKVLVFGVACLVPILYTFLSAQDSHRDLAEKHLRNNDNYKGRF